MIPRCYSISWTDSPPPFDGDLESGAWFDAPWTEPFVDITGDSQLHPRFRTRAKLLWDAEHLYLAAELEEPHLWATLTERDAVIFHDNDFEVFLDPDGDAKSYFEIEVNALNTIWDLWLPIPYRDGGSAVNEWDIEGLRTGVTLKGTLNDPADVDEAWTVEIAIPFSSLADKAGCQCPPSPGDVWRLNFSRVQWQLDVIDGKYAKKPNCPEDNWVWSPQGVVDMHQPEKWGYVKFAGPAT